MLLNLVIECNNVVFIFLVVTQLTTGQSPTQQLLQQGFQRESLSVEGRVTEWQAFVLKTQPWWGLIQGGCLGKKKNISN